MSNNLVFLSVFNWPAIELAKNHIKSLLRTGISNNMIYCYVTDPECLNELQSYDVNVTVLTSAAADTYLDFSSAKFNELCVYRYTVALELLKKGHDVWYMDVDTVAIQNLMPTYILNKETHDIVMQDDLNMPCTGCILFYNTDNTRAYLQHYIQEYLHRPAKNDQTTWLQVLLRYTEPLRFAVLPWHLYACGVIYFKELTANAGFKIQKCKEELENKRSGVMFVHANWMIGTDVKIEALKKYGHWYI